MKCPECKSESLQRIEVIWNEGVYLTSGRNTSFVTKPFGIIPEKRIDSKAKQISISNLAANCAPPESKNVGSALIAFIASILMAIYINNPGMKFMSVVCVITSFGFLAGFIIYNTKTYPEEYRTWKRTWFCHSCGKFYVQDKKKNKEVAVNNSHIIDASNKF